MAMQPDHWISLEEYDEIERNSDIKYEYSDGRIYAMAGGSPDHSRIALNLGGALNFHLRGKACRAFNSDMKVLPTGNRNPSYYPDISVSCDPEDYKRNTDGFRSPCLIVEVLSPSTALKDRGEKLVAYQACASVIEYVMISTHHQSVEVYRRESAEEWKFVRYTAGQVITLTSVEFTIPVSEIYADTDVPPLASILSAD